MTQGTDDLNSFLNSVGPIITGSPVVTATPKVDNREKFPCHECAGTGIWKGVRVHQHKRECFACKGKGYFLTSPQQREKARQQSATRKANALEAAKSLFNEAHPTLIADLTAISGWHSFAQNLLAGFNQYGSLTENQIVAAYRTIAKVEEKRKEREVLKAAKTGDVDVSKIVAAFNARLAKPFKKLPRFITERLIISAASPRGKNPGAIYVHCDGTYAGKIVDGRFFPVQSAPADILDLVRTVAADPSEIAKAYGKKTGICSCCGRELTDPASIEAGIGPICAAKWEL